MKQLSYSIDKTISLTGIGRTKLYQLINAGKLPARKIGKRTFILRDDLETFLKGSDVFTPKHENRGK